ncbi:hypothetical protein G5714_017346 [Onychostoma macrolepis]|uniref:Uncharacterized protein n=1 Tax=Onychostoma macrolepis TaxID=369639 RepID=A0A7J6C5Q7_9TELE|nr:hypothetical protein G5714_017346 [Onychostoma macrolepis]
MPRQLPDTSNRTGRETFCIHDHLREDFSLDYGLTLTITPNPKFHTRAGNIMATFRHIPGTERRLIPISSSSKRDKGTFPKDTPCSESESCYREGSNRNTSRF